MDNVTKKINKKKWITYFLFILATICSYFLIKNISGLNDGFNKFLIIVNPFIIGIVIAYILNIPFLRLNTMFSKRKNKFLSKNSKGLSVLIIYLLLILIIYLLLSMIIPNLTNAFNTFKDNVPSYNRNIIKLINDINSKFNLNFKIDPSKMVNIQEIISPDKILSYLQGALGISGAILNFVLAFIVSIYFLLEKESILAYIKRLLTVIIGQKYFIVSQKYLKQLNNNFHTFIYCQTLDGLILGTVATIALSLMNVKYAMILGPMLGFANVIPYFGSIIGTMIVVIIVMITDSIELGFITLAVLLSLQQIDGNLIQPKLLGSKLKLSPALIIISITIGGAYGGVAGMVVAIPIVAVLKNIIDDFIKHREEKKNIIKY